MKIEINLKIFIVLILFFLINNINTYLVFLFFILIHEIGHLLVGILIGGKPKRMSLDIFGVSLEFYSYAKTNSWYNLIFYLSGPAINIIIASVIYLLFKNKDDLLLIMFTNLAIGIFNLIPILPLDGGKILREVLKMKIGIRLANKISIYISKWVLVIISFVYSILIIKMKNIVVFFLLIYLWYLYSIEEKKYNIYEKTSNVIEKMI